MASSRTGAVPANVEAERWVLGACLKDPSILSGIGDRVTPEDFFLEPHRHVFKAILDLYGKGVVIGLVSVGEELHKVQMLEAVGGPLFLRDLMSEVGTLVGLEHHVGIVKEKSLVRRVIAAATDIASKGYDPAVEVGQFLDEAEKNIFSVISGGHKADIRRIDEVLQGAMKLIENQLASGKGMSGISTGFDQLDRILNGLQRSDLLILGARPAMGKTSLALSMANHIVVHERKAVALFSLEMAAEQLAMRLLASEAMVDLKELRGGRPPPEDIARIGEAAGRLSETNFFLDDTGAISLAEVRARCRRLALHGTLDVIMIDYLQLMSGRAGASANQPREQLISENSRGLKALAKELNVPVIVLSQLSRSVESRPDKRPMLSDLRESGAIEQDADIIMFVYRDEYYNPETPDKGVAEVIVAKQRNGPTDTAKLAFVNRYAKFANLAPSSHF